MKIEIKNNILYIPKNKFDKDVLSSMLLALDQKNIKWELV